jgi:DNA primase
MASLASLIKKKIEQGPGYEDFIRRYVDVEYINEQGEARFCCVAHEEDKSGCHFNTSTGLWKCFSGNCGAQGDVIDFFFYATKAKGKAEAIRQLAVDLKIIEDLSDDLIDGLEHALWSVPQILQRAEDDFGVTGETLKRYRIGFRFRPPDQGSTLLHPDPGREWRLGRHPSLQPEVRAQDQSVEDRPRRLPGIPYRRAAKA